jgi:translation initiation factor IF-3
MAFKAKVTNPTYRVNEEIQGIREVRITGDNIQSKVISLEEAKQMARKMNLDLVEINSSVKPHIVKIVNFEKWQYEQKKNSKKNKAPSLKEVQLSVNIADNDLMVKANKAKEFIKEGYKVKVTLALKGRELARREENKKSLLKFIIMMEEVAIPESYPKDEGNKCIVILKKRN